METLHILWTTTNKETFFNMLSMYAIDTKTRGWWKQVNVIIREPSAELIGTNKLVQSEIRELFKSDVTIEASLKSYGNFGVSEKLKEPGVTVRNMGEPFTEHIKNGDKILTL